MSDEQLSTHFAPSQPFPEPLLKANQRAVANLEKWVGFQMNALQFYVDLGLARLKAAAEVDNFGSLQAFFAGQMEVAGNLTQKLFDDTQTLVDLYTAFGADFQELAKTIAAGPDEKPGTVAETAKENARKTG